MKAIVKYIPIEGEKKEILRSFFKLEEHPDIVFESEIKDGKFYKYPIGFFAMTSHLKVGDKVAVFSDRNVFMKIGTLTFIEDDTVMVDGEDFSPNEGEAFPIFKILGEISTDAAKKLDIKNGQEIEVQYYCKKKGDMRNLTWRPHPNTINNSEWHDIKLEIKCPTCDAYHK